MAAAQGYPLLCLENPLLGMWILQLFTRVKTNTNKLAIDIQARGYGCNRSSSTLSLEC
jgi:hypothetical protein